MTQNTETAEDNYRAAFERLKQGQSNVVPRGTPVTQNNVAREAGREPDAFKKTRYPALIREIQAHIEISAQHKEIKNKRRERRHERQDLVTKAQRYKKQRDEAQSRLVSAHRAVLTLLREKAELQRRLDEYLPPLSPLWNS
ncbi:hypothetical protein B0G75_103553 [Paraburkholderia sp. BL18I3N2]|uniref:hypothetical protein n=1 Tax=Paraburkholderia sp. BL18I3N2 TaxID=1938799 RepID=UPI000D07FBD9|nr:hypothetical protein [Paraburkholderia sp. BL18I3N2]PRX33325.1 hypothetical protein B0G75_103553 [Paraburkholderia sp. BL18I3N2]